MRVGRLCAEHGVALAEAALAFPLLHPAVVNVTLGMRNAEQVDTDVALAEAVVPDAFWQDLAARRSSPKAQCTPERSGHRALAASGVPGSAV
jgi:aryl-alcohol dehydrogenase-like predicted oxidoreductase